MAEANPSEESRKFRMAATKTPHSESEDSSDDELYAVTESSSNEEDNPCDDVAEEKEALFEEFSNGCNVKETAKTVANIEEVETALIKWINEARSKNLPITGAVFQEKARFFAESLGCNVDTEICPSTVVDKDFIYMPPSSENLEEREEWKSGGKWLLFCHGDMQKLDNLFTNLPPLLADDTLLALKFSTATDRHEGVIMCYTANCDDRIGVKKAADAISNVALLDYIIYYKTNEASDAGIYAKSGNKFISKYMYSVAGSLYERDEYNMWKKVVFDLEN